MDTPGSVVPPALAERRAQRLALVALIAGALVIGVSPLLVRVSELGPIATAFWRVALAVPLFWIWRWGEARRLAAAAWRIPSSNPPAVALPPIASRRSMPPAATDSPGPALPGTAAARISSGAAYLALAGAFFAADLAIWHTSLGLTSVANSTFLVNMAPLGVVLAAWMLHRERPGAMFVAGLAIALVGALLLMRASVGHSARELAGDALALAAAGALAGYMLVVRYLRARYSTAQIMLASSLTCAALLAPLVLLAGELALPRSVGGWAVLVALALACHAGGQGLITYSLARLPAAFSSLALLLEPVAAAALAWVLLGEAMDHGQLAGGAAVLIGIAIARRGTGATA